MKLRNKVASFTMLDMYNNYNNKDEVEKFLYYKVINEFNKQISEEIVNNAYTFKLPLGLGSIFIDKKIKKNKTSVVDWKTTKVLWEEDDEYKASKKLVYELNSHSDGYVMKWKWGKSRYKNFHVQLFSFIPTRYNKRYLAKQIKLNKALYYDSKLYNHRKADI